MEREKTTLLLAKWSRYFRYKSGWEAQEVAVLPMTPCVIKKENHQTIIHCSSVFFYAVVRETRQKTNQNSNKPSLPRRRFLGSSYFFPPDKRVCGERRNTNSPKIACVGGYIKPRGDVLLTSDSFALLVRTPQSFVRGRRLRPKVRPLTLLYTIFDTKAKVYFLLTTGIFHISSLEFCIPFNCCMNESQTRTFSWLFQSHKVHLLDLLSLLQTKQAVFLTLWYTSISKIRTFLHKWSRKKVPLSRGAYPYRPL